MFVRRPEDGNPPQDRRRAWRNGEFGRTMPPAEYQQLMDEDSVNWYSRAVFPRICDFFLNTEQVAKQRRELLRHAGGDILEVGFGTGLNLPCYPAHVRKITTVDPNLGMHRAARKRIEKGHIDVDARVFGGEHLPFPNHTFDCVVSTFTLCSIARVGEAIAEIYRVLRPNGRYTLLEHGLSPDRAVQKWQQRLNWLQMRLGDGCRLDRNIKELVAVQPFASVAIDEFYMEKTPRTHGYLYRGVAAK
jgi:ubiquinone/menaquinone biosynthesis C-methylase UbiE